jgi:hypothetical protein
VENLWITCGKLDHGTEMAAEKIKYQAGCLFLRTPSRGLEIWGSKRYNDKHNN